MRWYTLKVSIIKGQEPSYARLVEHRTSCNLVVFTSTARHQKSSFTCLFRLFCWTSFCFNVQRSRKCAVRSYFIYFSDVASWSWKEEGQSRSLAASFIVIDCFLSTKRLLALNGWQIGLIKAASVKNNWVKNDATSGLLFCFRASLSKSLLKLTFVGQM